MIRVCINTQTPPIRPLRAGPGPPVWRLGVDYLPNVGGVVPMMRGLLRAGVGRWLAREPRWVALGDSGLPREVRTDEGYRVETFPLEEPARSAYGVFKEAIWHSFHGPSPFRFPTEAYPGFVDYSCRAASALLRHLPEFDLFYVNDFQQLLVGGLVGSAAPALLRWHIPVELGGYPEPVRRFFLRSMEGFDAIVVSTRGGLEELIRAGFQGRAYQVYPYLDPAEHRPASTAETSALRSRLGLAGDAPVVLSVGRMDPVKRQDLLVGAFARLQRKHPEARLLLVGGGSFSTRTLTARGRPSKASAWEAALRRSIRERGLERSVVVAGALSADELRAAYSLAQVFAHPAPWEGFGLVAVEAWCHRLPVVVSSGAGVSELVDDDVNGYTYPPGDVVALAERLGSLLDRPEAAARLGEVGALTARRCYVERAAPRLREIFQRTIGQYEKAGLGRRPAPGADS